LRKRHSFREKPKQLTKGGKNKKNPKLASCPEIPVAQKRLPSIVSLNSSEGDIHR